MLPESMTGYGRGVVGAIKAEARSFNHKNLDIQIKLPSFFYQFENDMRKMVKEMFNRGHIEIYITKTEIDTVQIKINKSLARGYYNALMSLKDELSIAGDININVLASYRDIFCMEEEDAGTNELNEAVKLALEELKKMRVEEGKNLLEDVAARAQLLKKHTSQIEDIRNKTIADTKQKLHDRLKEFLADTSIDESRLVQEAAILIERADITEEIVRIKSHLGHMEEMLRSGGDTVGKKLDFLVQELRREVNTISSKTNDVEVTNNTIEMKHEIEKIKEQIQNLQ